MSSTVETICAWCESSISIKKAEHNRQARNGRTHFFCSRSCSARFGNESKKNLEVVKICPQCKNEFISDTGAKSATFCSRSCASAGSVTTHRRETAKKTGKANLTYGIEQIANGLRKREAWKYAKLAAYLVSKSERHQFEYPIEGVGIFDLALVERKILVEFDGPEHASYMSESDAERDLSAANEGWRVVRVEVTRSSVIEIERIQKLLKEKADGQPQQCHRILPRTRRGQA